MNAENGKVDKTKQEERIKKNKRNGNENANPSDRKSIYSWEFADSIVNLVACTLAKTLLGAYGFNQR